MCGGCHAIRHQMLPGMTDVFTLSADVCKSKFSNFKEIAEQKQYH